MRPTFYESAEGIIQKMNNIQKKYLKHYKSDFELDKERIHEIETKNMRGRYVWIVRETGTYIVALEKDERPEDNWFYNAINEGMAESIRQRYFIERINSGFIMKSLKGGIA